MTTTEQRPVLQAAFRDASFVSKPDTRSVKMAHVLRPDGSAACGIFAVMGDREPAGTIHTTLRCKRAGCKGLWPQNDPTDEAYFCQDHSLLNATNPTEKDKGLL
ncbi:hypothetical protein D3C77_382600 [compost metagenome]